jgi:NADH-quinone oxidoreductase subunit L
MKYEYLPWLILFMPLLSAAVITVFTLRHKPVSSFISIAAILFGFAFTAFFICANGLHPDSETRVNWLTIGNLNVDFGLKLDTLSLMMMLIVTGVGGLIHIYSYAYMDEDRSKARFFACLSLFTFSMLGIVMANNFLMMFVFWELVGVSSYLLIGFWFEKPSAGDAAKKAFITNRLGDFGFLAGILMVWGLLHSLNFAELQSSLQANSAALGASATIAGLLIFCGAVGKSAQFPLHVWLPDAMEGPTPVSALIHAATMVAAGVYMLCRTFFLFEHSPDGLRVIAYIGGFTALLAALIAVQQNDIKRIIAYSTLSQLGYMVMAVGLASPTAAMFHLTTHAFFKALLFLSAGSVILGMHHEQDIWQMGNLRKKMPATFFTFLIGALALSGFWPLSGFFSKDSILAQAWEQHNYGLFTIGVFIAGLTTFYTYRLFFVVFYGKEKSAAAAHAHESSWVITVPLVVLAIFSAVGGLIGIKGIYRYSFSGEADKSGFVAALFEPFTQSPLAAGLGLLAFFVGLWAAWSLYYKAATDPLPAKLGRLADWMKNRFYFDELYEKTVIRLHDFIAIVMDWIDRWIVQGFCIGMICGGTDFTGRALRLLQTGNLQTYAFLFVFGVALLLYFVLVK